LIGSFISAFGLYNIHVRSPICEGGIFGMALFDKYWFDISPAISTFVLTVICYILAYRELGKDFIYYSLIAFSSFSVFYFILEFTDPLFPSIANNLLLAAVFGAMFIGTGSGLCVLAGGAQGGDDALAMLMNSHFGIRIENAYLITDFVVLLISLSYIPLEYIAYSMLSVFLSGRLVGFVVKIGRSYGKM